MSDLSINIRGRVDGDAELCQTVREKFLSKRQGQMVQVGFREETRQRESREPINLRFEELKDGRALFSMPLENIDMLDDDQY